MRNNPFPDARNYHETRETIMVIIVEAELLAQLRSLLLFLAEKQWQISTIGIEMLVTIEGSETSNGCKRPLLVDVMFDVKQGSTHIALDAKCMAYASPSTLPHSCFTSIGTFFGTKCSITLLKAELAKRSLFCCKVSVEFFMKVSSFICPVLTLSVPLSSSTSISRYG